MCRIGGRLRSMPVRVWGADGEIPPLPIQVSNPDRYPARGQCQAGSLTGAVASQRVTEAREGHLRMVGNHPASVKAWGWSRSQGFGCSPIKAVRELGSERRETVRSLSATSVGCLRGSAFSTRGPKWTDLWCAGCPAKGSCRVATSGRDNR